MRVVPAWLACPAKSKRQRPCGQISLASPTATSRSTRSRPCSTCSSTKVPTRSSESSPSRRVEAGVGDRVGEEDAVAVAQLARLRPTSSRRSPAASPGRRGRSASPPPRRRPPTPIGRAGSKPRSRSRSIAASADTTPSGPSYAPPSRTESRCEPVRTPRPGRRRGRPPGDLVADAVGLDGEPAGRALLGEPGPQLGLGRGPGLAEVAARRGRAADRRQVAPHLLEVTTGGHARSPSASPQPGQRAAPASRLGSQTRPCAARRCNARLRAVPTLMHGGG